jgi:hypothetical protein
LSLKVILEASSPSTGEERGEGALIFCPLTLTLSRHGEREPVSLHRSTSGIFRRIKVRSPEFQQSLSRYRNSNIGSPKEPGSTVGLQGKSSFHTRPPHSTLFTDPRPSSLDPCPVSLPRLPPNHRLGMTLQIVSENAQRSRGASDLLQRVSQVLLGGSILAHEGRISVFEHPVDAPNGAP